MYIRLISLACVTCMAAVPAALADPPKEVCNLTNATYKVSNVILDPGFEEGSTYTLTLKGTVSNPGWSLKGTNVDVDGLFYIGAGKCGQKILFGHGSIGGHDHRVIVTGHWRPFDSWKQLSIQVVPHEEAALNQADDRVKKVTHDGQVHLKK